MGLVEQLAAEGKVLVIRPETPLQVGRTGQDPAKLEALYQEGYAIAQRLLKR